MKLDVKLITVSIDQSYRERLLTLYIRRKVRVYFLPGNQWLGVYRSDSGNVFGCMTRTLFNVEVHSFQRMGFNIFAGFVIMAFNFTMFTFYFRWNYIFALFWRLF